MTKKFFYYLTPLVFFFLYRIYFDIVLLRFGLLRSESQNDVLLILMMTIVLMVTFSFFYLYLIGEKEIISLKAVSSKSIKLSLLSIIIMPTLLIGFNHLILKRELAFGPPVYYNPKVQPFFPLFHIIYRILASMHEEVVFRGGLMSIFLKGRWSKWGALVVSSALFSLEHMMPLNYHFSWQTFWYYLLFGLMFGLIFQKTKSLYPPIIAHIGVNVVFGILQGGYVAV